MAKSKYTRQKNGYFQTKAWDGTYNEDGSKHLKVLRSSKSSKDLEDKVNAFKEDVRQRKFIRKSDVSFYEYSVAWIKVYHGNQELNTNNMYKNIVEKHLVKIECNLSDISRAHYITLLNNTDGDRTKQQIQMTFKQIIDSAIHDKLLPPAASVDIFDNVPKVKYKSPPKRALYQYEKDAIKKADLSDRDRALVYILYGCGLRREEACCLTRFDFNFSKKELSVNKAIAYDVNDAVLKDTKNHVHRVVPIPDSVLPFLESYVHSIHGTYLFSMSDGRIITKSSYDKGWARIIDKLNEVSEQPIVGLTAHIFRHNFCSSLCYRIPEISIAKIAELLGDSEKMVIEVYNHIIAEKEKPMETVSNAMAL